MKNTIVFVVFFSLLNFCNGQALVRNGGGNVSVATFGTYKGLKEITTDSLGLDLESLGSPFVITGTDRFAAFDPEGNTNVATSWDKMVEQMQDSIGSSSVSQPSTQIVVGSGSGVTSYNKMTYTPGTNVFFLNTKSNQTLADTTGSSFSRPVANSIQFSTNPSSTNLTGIDYHGIDLIYSSNGTNIINQANLYPFESRATFSGSGQIGRLVPAYFQSANDGTGIAATLYGLRLKLENNGSGSSTIGYGTIFDTPVMNGGGITTLYAHKVNDITGGTGTSRYALHIGEVSGASTNNFGIYSNANSNFLDGVTVGDKAFDVNSGGLSLNTSTKQLTLGAYTSSTFDATISRFLGVNASGNVVTLLNPGGGLLPAGSSSNTLYHNGTNWVANNFFRLDALGRSQFVPTAATITSGGYENIIQYGTFSPTSGTGTYTNMYIVNTINQTGGANGITRSIWVSPTLTAAADYRGIEVSNNSGFAFYAGGIGAKNFFAGNTGVGTLAPARQLHVEEDDSNTNTSSYPMRVTSTSSGTVVAGFGTGIEYELETSTASTKKTVATTEAIFTDVTAGSEDADFQVKTVAAGTLSNRISIGSDITSGAVSNITLTASSATSIGTTNDKILFDESTDVISIQPDGVVTAEFTGPSLTTFTSQTVRLDAYTSGTAPALALREDDANGTNEISLKSPATLGADYTQTLTAATGEIPVVIKGSGSLNFSSTTGGTCQDLTLSVTGVTDGDVVSLGIPIAAITTNGQFTAFVSGANTVNVRFCTAVTEDPGSGTFKVSVQK